MIDQKQDNMKDIISDASENTLNQIICEESQNLENMLFQDMNPAIVSSSSQDPVYLSIVRLCFWDRKLQEIEHEEIKEVGYFLKTSFFYKI